MSAVAVTTTIDVVGGSAWCLGLLVRTGASHLRVGAFVFFFVNVCARWFVLFFLDV